MESWINSLIALATKPIRELAEGVRVRLASIWASATTVFTRWRARFDVWVTKGRSWAGATVRHALATANHLRWLAVVDLPRRASTLAGQLRQWVSQVVAGVADSIRHEAGKVRDWLLARIGDAVNLVKVLRDWTVRQVSHVLTNLGKLLERVFDTWASPQRLATWLVEAMAAALLELILRDVDRYAAILWRGRRDIEAQALTIADRVLGRIL